MSITLFFIIHEGIASSLLSVAEAASQNPNSNLSYLEIPIAIPIEKMIDHINKKPASLSIDDRLL